MVDFLLGVSVAAVLGVFVFFDARRIKSKNYSIGSPLIWAIGVILLAILVFPTYLVRRANLVKRYPEAAGEIKLLISPVAGWIVFSLLLTWTLLGVVSSFLGEDGADLASPADEQILEAPESFAAADLDNDPDFQLAMENCREARVYFAEENGIAVTMDLLDEISRDCAAEIKNEMSK